MGDPDAIEAAALPFDTLDVLVLCQGTVVYKRGEFERAGWDRVMAVNLDSLMHCARKFKAQLIASKGSLIIVSSISGLKANIGNPAPSRQPGVDDDLAVPSCADQMDHLSTGSPSSAGHRR